MKSDVLRERLLKLLDEPEQTFLAYLDTEKMEAVTSYLIRGRAYRAMADDRLTEMSAAAHTAWVDDLLDTDKLREFEDIGSEIRLRGGEPPLPPIDQLKRVQAFVLQIPTDTPKFEKAFEERYKRFLEAMIADKN